MATIRSGRIAPPRIDASVRRVVRAKFAILHAGQAPAVATEEVARAIALRSITLLSGCPTLVAVRSKRVTFGGKLKAGAAPRTALAARGISVDRGSSNCSRDGWPDRRRRSESRRRLLGAPYGPLRDQVASWLATYSMTLPQCPPWPTSSSARRDLRAAFPSTSPCPQWAGVAARHRCVSSALLA